MRTLDNELYWILDTLLGEWGASPAFEKDQIEKAKKAILEYMEREIIGADENEHDGYGLGMLNKIRNNVRQEQRLKIEAQRSKLNGGK